MHIRALFFERAGSRKVLGDACRSFFSSKWAIAIVTERTFNLNQIKNMSFWQPPKWCVRSSLSKKSRVTPTKFLESKIITCWSCIMFSLRHHLQRVNLTWRGAQKVYRKSSYLQKVSRKFFLFQKCHFLQPDHCTLTNPCRDFAPRMQNMHSQKAHL